MTPLFSFYTLAIVAAFLLFIVTALAIGAGLARLVNWTRPVRNYPVRHCRRCGYDLTGNVSGRCPECGAVA